MMFILLFFLSMLPVSIAYSETSDFSATVFGHVPDCNIIVEKKLKPSLNNRVREGYLMPYDTLDVRFEQTHKDNDMPDSTILSGFFDVDANNPLELNFNKSNVIADRLFNYSNYPELLSKKILPQDSNNKILSENKHFFVACIPGTKSGVPNKGDAKYWSTANILNVDGQKILIKGSAGPIKTPTATSINIELWDINNKEVFEHFNIKESFPRINISVIDEYGYDLWEDGRIKNISLGAGLELFYYSLSGKTLPIRSIPSRSSDPSLGHRAVVTFDSTILKTTYLEEDGLGIAAKYTDSMGRIVEARRMYPIIRNGLDVIKSQVYLSPERQLASTASVTFAAKNRAGKPITGLKPTMTVSGVGYSERSKEEDGGIYKMPAIQLTNSAIKNGKAVVHTRAESDSGTLNGFTLPLKNGFVFDIIRYNTTHGIPYDMDYDEAITITNANHQFQLPKLDDCIEIKKSSFQFGNEYYWVSDMSPSGLPYSMNMKTCEKRVETSKNIKLTSMFLWIK